MRLSAMSGSLALLLALPLHGIGGEEARVTKVRDAGARDRLVGKRRLSLQWVSWDQPGEVVVMEKGGLMTLAGQQRDEKTGNYVTIEGTIESIDTRAFVLFGTIVTRVDHIARGEPCTRRGRFTFRISGKRKYWRMKEMTNPCDDVTDYVDIFF